MTLRPLHDCVVVCRADAKVEMAGGIIIPCWAKERLQEAEITAVSPGVRVESGRRKLNVHSHRVS